MERSRCPSQCRQRPGETATVTNLNPNLDQCSTKFDRLVTRTQSFNIYHDHDQSRWLMITSIPSRPGAVPDRRTIIIQ
jgi:hypothetical protein